MKTVVLNDWLSFEGMESVELTGPGNVEVHFVTEGASFFVETPERARVLVGTGAGNGVLRFALAGSDVYYLICNPFQPTNATSLYYQGQRQLVVGWRDEPSIVQTELKGANEVSPEFQRAIEAVHRNALMREQRLQQHFEERIRELKEKG